MPGASLHAKPCTNAVASTSGWLTRSSPPVGGTQKSSQLEVTMVTRQHRVGRVRLRPR